MESLVRPEPPEAFMFGAPMQWKSADGTVWNITEMADDHLENCLRMMERNAVGILDRRVMEYVYGPQPGGDMAQLEFEREFDELLRMRYPEPAHGKSALDDENYPELVRQNALEFLREDYPPYSAMKAVLKARQDEMDRRVRESSRMPDWLEEFDELRVNVKDLADRIAQKLVEEEVFHCCRGEQDPEEIAQIVKDVINSDA